MASLRYRDPEAEDVALISDIVSRHRLPEFIEDFELRLGLDTVDEPAVWIVFHTHGALPRRASEADAWVAEMNNLANAIREEVIEAGVRRFPFFRFEPAIRVDKLEA